MRRLTLSLSFLILFASFLCSALEAELQTLLRDTNKNYQRLFAKSFTVEMVSPEINQTIASLVAAQARQMGVPLAIPLKHFLLTNDGHAMTGEAVLDVADEAMRAMLEPQANQILEAAGVNQAMATLSLGTIGKAAAILEEKQDKFTASDDTGTTVLLTAQDPEMTFNGLQVKTARVRLNKINHTITEFRFDFEDQSAIWLKIAHQEDIQGADSFQCPEKIMLRQNLKIDTGKVKLPGTINIAFRKYKFS